MKYMAVAVVFACGVLLTTCEGWSEVDGFKVEVVKANLPAGLPESMKKMVGSDCIKLCSADGKVIAEIWGGNEVTARQIPVQNGDLQALVGIPEGAFLGVIRLSRAAIDYKESGVKVGVYTMRYLTQPADGNHLGTAPYNDFAVLLLPKNDPGTPTSDRDELIKVALAQAAHPFVFGLVPPKPDTPLPYVGKGEENRLVVFYKFTAKSDEKTGEVKVGILPGFKAQ